MCVCICVRERSQQQVLVMICHDHACHVFDQGRLIREHQIWMQFQPERTGSPKLYHPSFLVSLIGAARKVDDFMGNVGCVEQGEWPVCSKG